LDVKPFNLFPDPVARPKFIEIARTVTSMLFDSSYGQNKNNMKKFVLLIYQGPAPPVPGTDRWKALSEAEQKAIYADYANFNNTPGVTAGLPLGLPDAARTVQVRNGKTHVKSGTYLAESAAGYAVYEAESIEAAVELATRIPAARLGGAVEIRPAEKYW
jgi:hypothetical protein